MTEKIKDLNALFVDTLKDLYNAEQQIVKALPKMINHAQSNDLKMGLQEHLDVTHQQIQRLDQIFQELHVPAQGKQCKGMEGLIKEGDEMMNEASDPSVRDAALIAAAQKVEHYEIASYGTARAYAKALGHDKIAQMLDKTADEEGKADKTLTKLAEGHINARAKTK